jgi:hypothetical protein
VAGGPGWQGLFLVRCASCASATLDAERNGWRFYADREDVLHPFCPTCAEAKFGRARASSPPVAMCPECDGGMQPQPLGGWHCEHHGLVVAPKLNMNLPTRPRPETP